jgi:hypothetical protein
MKATTLEIFLARLYADPGEVTKFLADRERYTKAAGLPAAYWPDLMTIDASALQFAVLSYARKRLPRAARKAVSNAESS